MNMVSFKNIAAITLLALPCFVTGAAAAEKRTACSVQYKKLDPKMGDAMLSAHLKTAPVGDVPYELGKIISRPTDVDFEPVPAGYDSYRFEGEKSPSITFKNFGAGKVSSNSKSGWQSLYLSIPEIIAPPRPYTSNGKSYLDYKYTVSSSLSYSLTTGSGLTLGEGRIANGGFGETLYSSLSTNPAAKGVRAKLLTQYLSKPDSDLYLVVKRADSSDDWQILKMRFARKPLAKSLEALAPEYRDLQRRFAADSCYPTRPSMTD